MTTMPVSTMTLPTGRARALRAAALLALPLALGAGLAALPAPAGAQGVRAEGAYGGYDDDRLYRDEAGALYRRRGGQYVPWGGAVEGGRPVGPDPDALRPRAAVPDPRLPEQRSVPAERPEMKAALNRPVDDGPIDYAKAYAAITDDPFPVAAFNWKKANPNFLRQEVAYSGRYEPGTIVVDPKAHHLYLVQANGRARRYGVGVGKQGFSWSGVSTVNSKQAWPDWYPPKEMIARRPDLAGQVEKLQSGVGVPGGTRNPLGARAMYLWQDNKDTLYRIHGTLEPESIGRSVSSGCIRMINQDAIDLFNRVEVGAKVVVLG